MRIPQKLKNRLHSTSKPPKPEKLEKKQAKNTTTRLDKVNGTAYDLVGTRIGRFLPIFRDLDTNLQKAALKINFKAYVALTVFTTLIGTITVGLALGLAMFFAFQAPALPSVLFGFGGGLMAGAFCVVGFYFYPIYRADKHKHDIEDELPFTTGYMAILASAGVAPEKIFSSLAALKEPLAASSEAKDVVRHISLFGMDIISALEKTSKRTPSEKLKEVLEGIITTMHSGGNLSVYLRERFKNYIKVRKLVLKKYADTLSVLAEVYVALLLTAPLLFVIMLSVMSVMGGGTLGAFSSDLLLKLITYIAIPFAAVIFLIIVDSSSPKW